MVWSDGCLGEGDAGVVDRGPVVTVSAGLVREDLVAAGPGYAFVGTAASTC